MMDTRMDNSSAAQDLRLVDLWWRAANYLSVGQIYLLDNPLLQRPLEIGDIKPRLLGHWGTTPGINLVWAHMNRVIVDRQLSAMFVCGPGHGGPAANANPWLEGTYGELYPELDWSTEGLRRFFRQFSFPGGISSHASPEVPGSIHEGGELGYSLAHAYGAVFDAPDELVVCMVGDGEAETGALATSWHSHRFIDARRDGAVLPVLHLNGYKIASPTVLARMPESQLVELLRGYGYMPLVVSGGDPDEVHPALADALDSAVDRIGEIQAAARRGSPSSDAVWPMIVLRTPKGWTGPVSLDGEPVEGSFRSHQVPIGHDLGDDELVDRLRHWLQSYKSNELFTAEGSPTAELEAIRPAAHLRMGARERTNPGTGAYPLTLPEPGDFAVEPRCLSSRVGAMEIFARYLSDTIERNPDRFRLFGPDEVDSNRLSAVFGVTDRAWAMTRLDTDESLAPDGRVMEVLSEHLCQGWLEGYLLTGRHGLFTSYEAFIHIVDSMFNQHAKWIESAANVPWRRPIPSFTYLLSSHVWRQDHNGFSHQDPGFLDVVANKKADVVRIYLPPDANSLLAVMDHCLRSSNLINVVVAGKQPEPQYLSFDGAEAHAREGLGRWDWAGTEADRGEPELVLGCAGDVPTMETVAAAKILATHTDVSVRVVNVIDLMTLQSPHNHPHGLDDERYDALFPPGVPTVFAFHGYPWLVHRLTYKRHHHDDLHVHGYIEEGSTTTPFDMLVRNRLDRFHLVLAGIEALPPARRADLAPLAERMSENLERHARTITTTGDDLEEIRNWTFARSGGA